MRDEQKKALTSRVGLADASQLIELLDSLGVENDIELTTRGISIPKSIVRDVPALQVQLSVLSKVGRAYEISEGSDRIIIDTTKLKSSYFSTRSAFTPSIGKISRDTSRNNPWGIMEEHVQLPTIPHGSKVLDVGAGSGLLAEKMRDLLGCEVFALEPSFERSSDYDSCVKRLGKDRVERLTLQEALATMPEKYFQAFDVVTVFKYNVPGAYKEEFISGLAKVVKPGGTVFITSVEPERFYRDSSSGDVPYLTEMIQKYFGNAKIQVRNSFQGSDGLMICSEPTPSLDDKVAANPFSSKK